MSAAIDPKKAAIVLVHGAWHGVWCWRRVLPLLRSAGLESHSVTLTGVSEPAALSQILPDIQRRA